LLRDTEFGVAFLKRHPNQLLFGTDYYDLTQKDFLQFSLFQQLSVEENVRNAVCWDNARRLLKLS
jgi:predicted TIM-barrel fold metal-dependent hydrolase